MEEQQNRHHKKNEKLDKKRKKDKELKKIKKAQKKAYDLLRDEKRENFFSKKDKHKKGQINRDKALKAFKSFIKIYQDDLEDFFELFQQLDEGNVVDTGDIENSQIKEKLNKFMKKLKLKNKGTDDNPSFKKINDIKLESYVRGMYDEVVKGIQYKESDQSDSSDSESLELKDKDINKSTKNQQQNLDQQSKKEENNNQEKQQQRILNEEVYQDKKFDRNAVRTALYSDYDINKQKQNNRTDELDQFLENQFSKVDDKKLSSYLNDRKKIQTQSVQQQKNESLYLGQVHDVKRTQEENREFMTWYDQTYRQKSLSEIHQEKLAQEKMQKQGSSIKQSYQRKEFNRDTDMGMGQQTGQQAIQQIRQSGSLGNKFSSGHLQNSFI